MNKTINKILILIGLLSSFYIQGMQGQISEVSLLESLPNELLVHILSQDIAESNSLAEMLKKIHKLRMVNRKFKEMFDPISIAKHYIKTHPKQAEEEFSILIEKIKQETKYLEKFNNYMIDSVRIIENEKNAHIKFAKIFLDAGMAEKEFIRLIHLLLRELFEIKVRRTTHVAKDILDDIKFFIDNTNPEIIKNIVKDYVRNNIENAEDEFINLSKFIKLMEQWEKNAKRSAKNTEAMAEPKIRAETENRIRTAENRTNTIKRLLDLYVM